MKKRGMNEADIKAGGVEYSQEATVEIQHLYALELWPTLGRGNVVRLSGSSPKRTFGAFL
jgi:hypothetical protein